MSERDAVDGTWRYQWPAGTRFLAEIDALVQVRGRRVIDLGCGQGRLGRWALEAGAAQVLFADIAADALSAVPAHPRALACMHRWGEPLPACDVLLGGDILYRPSTFPDLLASVGSSLRAPDACAWLVDPRSTLDAELPVLAESNGLSWCAERRPAGYTLVRCSRMPQIPLM